MEGRNLEDITDKHVGDLLSGSGLTVVLMTSSWNGDAIIMRSLLGSMTSRYGKVRFCVADVEKTPTLSKLFNVNNPPLLIFLHNGEMVHRVQGAVSSGSIRELINNFA